MKTKILYLLSLFLFLISCEQHKNETIDLSGKWQFKMDTTDVGVKEKWFETNFLDTVQLPGSMVENGKGFEITLDTKWTGGVRNPDLPNDPNYAPYHDSTNIRFPYWLQPLKKYTGAAWYKKTINIPEDWDEKTVWLNLERVHWESTVWVNNDEVGMQNSLATPHQYEITSFLNPGENTITICVDNRTKKLMLGMIRTAFPTTHNQTGMGLLATFRFMPKGIYISKMLKFSRMCRAKQ